MIFNYIDCFNGIFISSFNILYGISDHFAEKVISAPIILLLMLVLAQLIRASLPKSLTLELRLFSIYLHASLHAILYPLMILVGWSLFLIKSLAFFNNSEARITTDVVPSPTSLS